MHVQKTPDPMPRSMPVLQSCVPKRDAGNAVNHVPCCIFREDQGIECDVAFENAGVVLFFLGGGVAKVECAGDVCCSVQVLASGIEEVDLVPGDEGGGIGVGCVVDYCGVGSRSGDGLEG